jgi:ADP-ribose pyrophosphatase
MTDNERDRELIERQIDSEAIFDGALLHVKRDRVSLPDGSTATREYIVHPGAVMIIPRLPDGLLLFERQFRYPHRRIFIEFPAGKIERDEDPLETAKRELIEETGYAAADWTYLATMHPVIGYSDERILLYIADGLTHVGANLDAGEFVEVFTATLDQALEWVDSGEITDAKTMTGVLLLARRGNGQAVDATGTVVRRLFIRGRVQGVGYRYAFADRARASGVTGWVGNRSDGSVEAVVAGEPSAVQALTEWAWVGPAAARVDAVDVEPEAAELAAGFEHFSIAHTA